MLDFEVIEAHTETKASVIMLHGLGASGHDLMTIVSQLQLPDTLGFRFIFPHAPVQPVTLSMGMSMRAWYDIYGLDRNSRQDVAGVKAAIQWIGDLIQEECQSQQLESRQIFLAGFSQGGALALGTALQYPKRLAGVVALSTYLPIANHLLANLSLANRDMPIFVAHGTQDDVVSFDFGELACQHLRHHGYPVTWRDYPMAHVICPQELTDINTWLQKTYAASHMNG